MSRMEWVSLFSSWVSLFSSWSRSPALIFHRFTALVSLLFSKLLSTKKIKKDGRKQTSLKVRKNGLRFHVILGLTSHKIEVKGIIDRDLWPSSLLSSVSFADVFGIEFVYFFMEEDGDESFLHFVTGSCYVLIL